MTKAGSPRTDVQLAREGIVLAGGGAAIALQVAHRPVAAGVQHHSNFTADPLGRLRRTLEYLTAVVLPEAGCVREKVTGWVSRAHDPVAGVADGAAYSAADPHTQLWVAATLYWSAEQVRWHIWGEQDPAAAEEIYRRYAVLGTALGMPESLWPADRAAFYRYWERQVANLDISDDARRIIADLFAAESAPWWLRSVMPTTRFLTAGLLPPTVRAQLGLDWDGANSVREDRLWRSLGRVYPHLPEAVRHAPARFVVAGLHKQFDESGGLKLGEPQA